METNDMNKQGAPLENKDNSADEQARKELDEPQFERTVAESRARLIKMCEGSTRWQKRNKVTAEIYIFV